MKLKDKLNLPAISTKEILIKEFGNEQGTLKMCETVQLAVHCADNLTVYINAFVVELICSPLSNQAIDFAQANYSHIKNLPLADSGDGSQDLDIDILIGADFVHLFMLDQVVRGEHPMSPVAILTRFGYVLSGPIQIPTQNECSSNITVAHVLKTDAILVEKENDLEDEIKRFWNHESLGVKSNENIDDFESENLMQDKIKFDGKRYEISLPLKDDHPIIPDNYNVAKSRLNSQLDRLKLKPEVFDEYNFVIKDQLNSGIIEKVIEDEEIPKPGMTHQNVSHAVQKENEIKVLGMTWNAKTDKLKFDLASFFEAAAQDKITKRLILSSIARIYDPLGLLSPLLVPLKRLFQDVCKLKVNWDSCLPDEFCQRWHNIVNDIPQDFNVEVDRSFLGDISCDEIQSIQIHGFADASQIAYGAGVYVRIKTDKGIFTKLVSGKSRIGPLKTESMPRSELMAAQILAKLIYSVQNTLKECCQIESIHCCSRSQVVLNRNF